MGRTWWAVFLAASCVPEPPLGLRDTMLLQEIEIGRLEVAVEKGAPQAERLESARALAQLSSEDVFDTYASRSDVRDRAEAFRAFVRELRASGDELVRAFEAGEDAAGGIARLRASCDACHAVFRPNF